MTQVVVEDGKLFLEVFEPNAPKAKLEQLLGMKLVAREESLWASSG